MKNSIIWTTAGIAVVGFGVPAFAAMASPALKPQIAPAGAVVVTSSDDSTSNSTNSSTVTVVSTPASLPKISVPLVTANATASSVEDLSGNCDEAEHANDASCTGTKTSDDTTASTPSSVEDVSGPCDEPEHANDPSCTGTGPVTSVDDNSGTKTSVEDSPSTVSTIDDHGGNTNSGGGSGGGNGGGADDSGHGSGHP